MFFPSALLSGQVKSLDEILSRFMRAKRSPFTSGCGTGKRASLFRENPSTCALGNGRGLVLTTRCETLRPTVMASVPTVIAAIDDEAVLGTGAGQRLM
jgi:hypothetical protein